jgi:hypothetical protein
MMHAGKLGLMLKNAFPIAFSLSPCKRFQWPEQADFPALMFNKGKEGSLKSFLPSYVAFIIKCNTRSFQKLPLLYEEAQQYT